MNDYLCLCSGPDGVMYKLVWKLVSYLALDLQEQQMLVGPTRQWFVKEDPHVNLGANYLCGTVGLLNHYGGGQHFNVYAPNEVNAMSVLLQELVRDNTLSWSFMELERDDRWLEIRALAKVVLEKAGLYVNPPKKPIWFPDELEIWWDDYRTKDKAGMTLLRERKHNGI